MAKIDEGFNKFQYSKFDKKGGQLVIRTNDQEEFEKLVGFTIADYMNEEAIEEALKEATPPTHPASTEPLPPKPSEYCPDCGSVKEMGKKGLYCKKCYIEWAKVNKPQTGYKNY